jgi:hypothetical protein
VRIKLAVSLIAAALLIDESIIRAQEAKKPTKKAITIVGRVSARVSDMQLGPMDHADSFAIFIVWMESKVDDRQPGKYVKVYYLYSSNKDSLPASFFDYSIRYRFHLLRDSSCDGFVTDIRDPESEKFPGLSAEVTPSRGSPLFEWVGHPMLDCYLLSPGKYKVQK